MFVQKLMAGYIHATTIVSLNAMAPCSVLLNEIYEDLSLSLCFLSFSSGLRLSLIREHFLATRIVQKRHRS